MDHPPPDVIATTFGGARPSDAVARSDALLGYESGNPRPPAEHPVEFVDYPFTKDGATFEDHLAAVKQDRPKYAVAPDVEGDRDLELVIEQADRLAEYAETVIVVPKSVHPTEVPDRFRVGVPLADFGSDAPHQWTDYADAGDLHLLGGSPTLQFEAGRYLPGVRSLDGASVFKGAERGNVWAPARSRNWHPTGPDQMGYYDRVIASLNNVVEAWTARDEGRPGDYTIPEDPDDYADALARAEPEKERIRTDRAYMDAGARGAPMAIHPDDLDLWDTDELDHYEVRDFDAEMEAAEREALESLRDEFEQAGLTDYGEPVATDGGDRVDPRNARPEPEGWDLVRDQGRTIAWEGGVHPKRTHWTEYVEIRPSTGALEVVRTYHDHDHRERTDPWERIAHPIEDVEEAVEIAVAWMEENEPSTPGGVEPPKMYWVKAPIGPQPWLDGEAVLVSAGVAWRNPGEGFTMDIPDAETLFVDSGGYQAAVHFGDEYPYSPTELFEWAEEIGADYVAGMDWACEDAEQLADLYDDVEPEQIAPVEDRLEWSIRDQRRQLDAYEAGDWSFQLVPVVQGLTVDQYRWSARKLRQHDLARPYMGIGTVCKRTTADGILDVLDACEEELPATEWHLFGATKIVWNDRRFWGRFRSADTHAWAMKTPEGEWTANDEDKIRAFEAYSDDILDARDRMASQQTFDAGTASRSLASSLMAVGAKICVCGTCIPAYATDFEPGCRHCELTALNRWDAALADAEHMERTMTDDNDPYDPTDEWSDGQASLTGGRAEGQARFDAPADTSDPEIESIDEVNPGGLLADERDDTDDPTEADQGTLDVGAAAQRDPGTAGLEDFGTDDEPDDDGDEWADSFDVPDETPAPEYVGEWDRVDDAPFLTYEADGMRARVRATGSGNGHMAVFENLYSEAADPSETIESYFTDASEERAKRTLVTWLKANDPEDALEKLPNWASDRDPAMAEFDPEERGRIKHHAEVGDMGSLLRTIGADTRMDMADNFAAAGIMSIADLAEHDDYTEVEGVGPKTAEKIEAAVPMIEKGLRAAGLDADTDDDQDDDDGTVSITVLPGEPEDDAQDFDVPREVNGWVYDDDAPPGRGAIVWSNPANPDEYVFYEQTGGHTWMAGLRGPDRESKNRSTGDPDGAIAEAQALMRQFDPSEPDDGTDDDGLAWAEAVERLRSQYDDSYSSRIEAAAEISREATDVPQELGGEAVMQPLLRYQQIDPADAYNQIENKHGEAVAERVEQAVIEYAATIDPDEQGAIEDLVDRAKALVGVRREPVPEPEREMLVETEDGDVIDRREVPDSGLSVSDLTDWPYRHDERENPEERDHFEDVMSDIYDPTDDTEPISGTDYVEQTGQAAAKAITDIATGGGAAGGEVVVGNATLDVPAPFGGWDSLEFTDGSVPPEVTDDRRGPIAVYVGPDREHSVVVKGTTVSNKWGIKAYHHPEPIPSDPDGMELRYGPGGADSDSEDWRITHGNVVDASAGKLLDENLPTLAEVRDHFADDADDEEIPDAVADAGTLVGEFEFKGLNAEPYMADGDPEPSGPFYYWKRDSDSMVGVFETDEWADDGYPFAAAKWVNPRGENPYWKYTHIAGTWEDAVEAARNTADHRIFIVESESGETYTEWVERTGGTGYEHPVTVPWEESDDDQDDDRRDVPDSIGPWEFAGYEGEPFPTYTYHAEGDHPKIEHYTATVMDKGADHFEVYVGPNDERNPRGSYSSLDAALNRVAELDTGTRSIEDDREAPEPDDPPLEARAGERVEFGRLDAANEWRDENEDHLHPNDDRRRKTVVVIPDAPDDVLDDAGREAAKSRQDEHKKYGQTPLSEGEREKLKRSRDGWTWGKHGFEAQAAKAALIAEGATDWMNYYEKGEGVGGSLKNLEAAKERQARGGGPTAIKKDYVDSDPDPGAAGRMIDQAQGEMCNHARDACESGQVEACEALLDDCGYSEEEIEEIVGGVSILGEDPTEVFPDPESFAEWARENEPRPAEEPLVSPPPEPPTDPLADLDDEQLAEAAPKCRDCADALPGPALNTLRKAWSGYKLARVEAAEAADDAEHYAKIINGVRVVHGQPPLDFEDLPNFDTDAPVPDDPTEEFPTADGTTTIKQAGYQGTLFDFGAETPEVLTGSTYDPTEEF